MSLKPYGESMMLDLMIVLLALPSIILVQVQDSFTRGLEFISAQRKKPFLQSGFVKDPDCVLGRRKQCTLWPGVIRITPPAWIHDAKHREHRALLLRV